VKPIFDGETSQSEVIDEGGFEECQLARRFDMDLTMDVISNQKI